MKSLLITAVLCLFATSIYAQKIVVESGDLDFLKNEKSITVKFTYENMLVGKMTEEEYVEKKRGDANAKKPGSGDDWYESWIADRKTRFEPKFIELFNKYTGEKGAQLTTADDSKYIMTVNTHFTEPGFNVVVAAQYSSINARAIFTDRETGKELAVVSIDNSSAKNAGYDVGYRIQESYAKAGRELAKFLNKKLKW